MAPRSIRAIPVALPPLYAFEVDGRIAVQDVEWMAGVLEAAFAAQETVDILIVMRNYQGLDVGAAFDSKALRAQARAATHVGRYAVVGAPDWAEAMINLLSPVSPVEAKTFDLEDEGNAWAWVRAA